MDGLVDIMEQVKDWGFYVDKNLNYEEQLRKAVSKTKQKTAWVLRTFSTREVGFLRTFWRTTIQCHLDYGNILFLELKLGEYMQNKAAGSKAYLTF